MPSGRLDLILAVDAIKRPLTGIGRYVWELATRMPRLPDVAEVRYYKNGRFVGDLQSLLDQPALKLAARRRLLRNRLAVGTYRRIAPMIHRWRLKTLDDHLFHGPNFYLPSFPGRKVATIHDLSVYRYPQFHPPERVAFMTKEIPLALQRADLLITDSEFIRREVIEFFGWPETRVVAVPLGASGLFVPRDAGMTGAALARYDLAHGTYVLCAATIEPRKNIRALLDAYSGLPASLRSRFPLVLVGSPGWRSDDIHEAIASGIRQGWLKYPGFVEDYELSRLFSGARGFALPSLYEGFGLPVLEAMASGVPVLTSRDSALSELSGAAALLVEPRDTNAIRDGLVRLLEDDDWRQASIPRALAVAARHSWDLTAQRTLEAYRVAQSGGR